jgi:hypothetical protein
MVIKNQSPRMIPFCALWVPMGRPPVGRLQRQIRRLRDGQERFHMNKPEKVVSSRKAIS